MLCPNCKAGLAVSSHPVPDSDTTGCREERIWMQHGAGYVQIVYHANTCFVFCVPDKDMMIVA
jgi:hypothetical protein